MNNKKLFSVFLTSMFTLLCGALLADGATVNAITVSMPNKMESDVVYFYRKFTLVLLAIIPFIVAIGYSFYHKLANHCFVAFNYLILPIIIFRNLIPGFEFIVVFIYYLMFIVGLVYFNKSISSSNLLLVCFDLAIISLITKHYVAMGDLGTFNYLPFVGFMGIYGLILYFRYKHIDFGIRSAMGTVLIIISFFMIISAGAVTCRYPSRYAYTQKTCYSNMRVIQGAIEMYNMDNTNLIDELNNESFKNLIGKKYLKNEMLLCPAGDINKYKGTNLAGVGEVYCGT